MAKQDERIQKLIKEVEDRKEKISKVDRISWVTNCRFKYKEGEEASFNIQTVTNKQVLVVALAFLLREQKFYDEANERLGQTSVFSWCSYSLLDWERDFGARISKIDVGEEKKNLLELEKKLSGLMSEDLKADIQLKEIEDLLK